MLVQVIVLIVLLLILLIPKFLKFSPKHSFKQDQLIQKEKDDRKLTFLYKLSASAPKSTSDYILRYTMVSDSGNRSLVISYENKFKNIVYYVYMYSISNKLIGILEVEEHASKLTSELIELPSNCKKININVIKVNDEVVEQNPIKKLSFGRLFFYSVFAGGFVSQLLFIAANLLFPVYTQTTIEAAQVQLFNLAIISGASFVYFVGLLIVLIRRNKIKR